MARLTLMLILILGTASCGKLGLDRIGFGGDRGAKRGEIVADGVRYKARLGTDSADKRAFTITATPVASNPKAALEAGRYQATKYCLKTYGGSETAWTYGPDTPVDQLVITDDTITLTGRCAKR